MVLVECWALGSEFWVLGSLALVLGSGFGELKRCGLGTTGSNLATYHHMDGYKL